MIADCGLPELFRRDAPAERVSWQIRRNPQSAIRNAPRGFTLLEMLLTLAVLVAVGALVSTTLTKPLAVERLKKAADLVRSEWTRARVAAMSSGTTHVFFAQPDSGTYQVQAWAGTDYGTEAAGPTDSAAIGDKQLPEEVVFAAGQTALDARASQAAASAGQTVTAAALPPVFFYPDGTATDAALVLRNEYGVCVQLDLRGLTGIATVSDTFNMEGQP